MRCEGNSRSPCEGLEIKLSDENRFTQLGTGGRVSIFFINCSKICRIGVWMILFSVSSFLCASQIKAVASFEHIECLQKLLNLNTTSSKLNRSTARSGVDRIEKKYVELQRSACDKNLVSQIEFDSIFTLEKLRDPAESVKRYQNFIQKHPGHFLAQRALLNIGDLSRAKRDLKSALAAYDSASGSLWTRSSADKDSESLVIRAHFGKASCFLDLSKTAMANKELGLAEKLEPQKYGLGDEYRNLKGKSLEQEK